MATLENISLGGGLTIELGKPILPDPYFNLTTFLYPGEGTNNGTNNTFLDSSSNARTVTRVGSTTQGTVSPFCLTGWSVNSQSPSQASAMSVPNDTSFDLASGDFTIECWLLFTKTFTSTEVILTKGYPATFAPFLISTDSATNSLVFSASSNGTNFDIANARTISTNPSLNTWLHVAITRNGNTFRTFLNGSQVDTWTSSLSFVTNIQNVTIYNGSTTNTTTNQCKGFISNLRIVKGTAVYTSNFTVPISPLTNISGTSLLTCQSNRFIDNSSFNWTITPSGEIAVQPFSPFAPVAPYEKSIVGGSGSFVAGDELSFTALNTTGVVTAECWFYRGANSSASHVLFAGNTGSTASNTQFNVNNDGSLSFILEGQIAVSTTAPGVCQKNAWNHIAFVKGPGNGAIFVNGIRRAYNPDSLFIFFANCSIESIGGTANGAGTTNGYISGVRVTTTVVYDPAQATYTIPSLPPTDISGTYILLNFTNGQISDATSRFASITFNQMKLSNAISKWGTTSMLFEGTGDCFSIPASTLQNIGRGNFTLEFWMYSALLDGAARGLVNGNQFLFYAPGTAGGFYLNWYINYAPPYDAIITLPRPSFVLNTWQHIAVVRNNTTFTVYQQGNSIGSATSSITIPDSTGILIGAESTNPFFSNGFVGYMNDIRFSLVARYTSNFTPPVEAFPLF